MLVQPQDASLLGLLSLRVKLLLAVVVQAFTSQMVSPYNSTSTIYITISIYGEGKKAPKTSSRSYSFLLEFSREAVKRAQGHENKHKTCANDPFPKASRNQMRIIMSAEKASMAFLCFSESAETASLSEQSEAHLLCPLRSCPT